MHTHTLHEALAHVTFCFVITSPPPSRSVSVQRGINGSQSLISKACLHASPCGNYPGDSDRFTLRKCEPRRDWGKLLGKIKYPKHVKKVFRFIFISSAVTKLFFFRGSALKMAQRHTATVEVCRLFLSVEVLWHFRGLQVYEGEALLGFKIQTTLLIPKGKFSE